MVDPSPRRRLAVQVTVATLVRWVMNVGHRMAYPFLPAIARGLGVSLASAGLLMTARSAVGLASPLFGPLSDRFGRRRMMAAGLLLLCGGSMLIALIPHYPAAVAGFLLLGLAKIVFDPSLQAYLGDRVPYRRRGLVIAVTELSWAGAILLGAPAIGWLIERAGWRMPFGVLAALAVAGLAAFLWALPNDDRSAAGAFARSFSAAFRLVLSQRAAVGALSVTFLLMMANEVLFIVYGTWMETSFGLSVSRLGLATTVIGVAELLGEIGVGGLADRLGKRRAVTAGLALTSVAYVALPFVSTALRPALAGLFLLFFGFEFTIVAVIPLATELVPAARGTMMALNVAALSLGRAVGAPLGTALWSAGGLFWNGLLAGLITLVAFGLLTRSIGADTP